MPCKFSVKDSSQVMNFTAGFQMPQGKASVFHVTFRLVDESDTLNYFAILLDSKLENIKILMDEKHLL